MSRRPTGIVLGWLYSLVWFAINSGVKIATIAVIRRFIKHCIVPRPA
jgi:hypothetical protein